MYYEIAVRYDACEEVRELLRKSDTPEMLREMWSQNPSWASWARWKIPAVKWVLLPSAARILLETNPTVFFIGFSKIWSFAGAHLEGANLEFARLQGARLEFAHLECAHRPENDLKHVGWKADGDGFLEKLGNYK